MPGAHEEMALVREIEQGASLERGLHEWLLHVYVRTGLQSLARGVEMGAPRCAHVHNLRLEVLQQSSHRPVLLRARTRRELLGAGLGGVINCPHDMRNLDPPEGVQMATRHSPRPYESDP